MTGQGAIIEISERLYEALLMRAQLQMPLDVIAIAIKRTPSAAAMRMQRAREALGVKTNSEAIALFRAGRVAMKRSVADDAAPIQSGKSGSSLTSKVQSAPPPARTAGAASPAAAPVSSGVDQ